MLAVERHRRLVVYGDPESLDSYSRQERARLDALNAAELTPVEMEVRAARLRAGRPRRAARFGLRTAPLMPLRPHRSGARRNVVARRRVSRTRRARATSRGSPRPSSRSDDDPPLARRRLRLLGGRS